MRIAILGAGFAGLSTAWHLLNYTKGSIKVDLFDPQPIGGGASGISSGLLHAFSGKHAKLSWESVRGMRETHRLLTESSRALNSPLVLSKGILRPAVTEEQISLFRQSALQNAETEWWEKEKCEKTVKGLLLPQEGGALYIKTGLTIDVQRYLQGLWQACALLGTQFHQTGLIRKSELQGYDRTLIAMGPLSKNFPGLQKLPISAVKGQVLELKWPENLPPLPFSLVSKKYLVMGADLKTCFAGATFEHQFSTPHAELEKAEKDIRPQISSFFPSLKDALIVGSRVGFRATSPKHLPLLGRISEKIYFFTSLGSKGLLYHGWLGKRMARAMLSEDLKNIPEDVLYHLL